VPGHSLNQLDGLDGAALAAQLALPAVHLFQSVGSTMDEAHRLAADGAPGGTLVIAGEQTAGRGRAGKRWSSAPLLGLWLTLIERPETESGLDVLSLRLGLHAAPILDAFVDDRVALKWPNDLYVGDRKLGGILVEARWRDQRPDWVAIGVGVNIVPPPDMPFAIGVRPSTPRVDLLHALVPSLRAAASARGPLSRSELAAYADRDFARGKRLLEPARGVALGITDDGALIIKSSHGLAHFRGGSLVFDREQHKEQP
jgi:BirA family biotin operon repressor/biotin-[acetyl-CoA-carboxylase] ligase